MPLIILGFVFVVGLFAFYLASTTSGPKKEKKEKNEQKKKYDEDLETKENVIFLPDDIEKIKEKHKKH